MKNVSKMIAVLSACFALSACNTDELVHKAMTEAGSKAKQCGMDQGKLFAGFSFGDEWTREWGKSIARKAKKTQKRMKDLGIDVQYSYAADLKGRCQLSQEALAFNAGSMGTILVVQNAIEELAREGQYVGVTLRLVITGKKGKELQKLNDEAGVEVVEGGRKVLSIYVNTGEYESSYGSLPLMEKLASAQNIAICPIF